MSDFATTYLKYRGYPVTPSNVQFLRAFARKEGGHTNNSASYNWLNTTRGSQYPSINSVGVRAFPDMQTGLKMLTETMRGYPTMESLLAQGRGSEVVTNPGGQGDLNRWLTGKRTPGATPYVSSIASLMGQKLAPTPTGGAPVMPAQTAAPRQMARAAGGSLGSALLAAASSDPRQQTRALLGALIGLRGRSAPAPTGTIGAGGPPLPAMRPPMGGVGAPATAGGIRELFYDPAGAYDEGKWISPIGGHGDHVHVSFGDANTAMTAIQLAQRLGLRASENPWAEGSPPEQGVHTSTSYHYQMFPGAYEGGKSPQLGRALDVSGDKALMARYFNQLVERYGLKK